MAIARFQLPDGRVARFEVPDGTTQEQAKAHFDQWQQSQTPAKPPAAPAIVSKSMPEIYAETAAEPATLQFGPWDTGLKISPEVNTALASAGGTTINTIEGLKDLFRRKKDPDLTSLITGKNAPDQHELDKKDRELAMAGLSDANPKSAFAGNVAAQLGMMFTGGAGLKGAGMLANSGRFAQYLPNAAPVISNVLTKAGTILQAPKTLPQAAGTGAAWNAATTEGDAGDRALSAGFGAIGGTVGYGIGKGIGAGVGAVGKKIGNALGKAKPASIGDIDALITSKFGVDHNQFNSLPDASKIALRKMANDALSNGGNLTPEMMQRAADFKTAGIETPLKGWVTREPMDWVQAHQMQGVDPDITKMWSGASQSIVNKVQKMAPEGSDYAVGSKFADSVKAKDAELKAGVDAAYQKFRDMGGKDVPLDAAKFNNEVAREIDEKMIGGKLPASVLGWFQKINDGAEPFTFSTAAQRMQNLNGLIRNSNDPAERYALNIVKSHLTKALAGDGTAATMPALADGASPATQKALSDAFAAARGAAKNHFDLQQASKLHEAVTSGDFVPEKLPDLIKSISVDGLKKMAATDAKYGTQSLGDLRDAAATFIRDSTVLQGETGGKLSVAGLRKALDKIGPENGQALFGPKWNDLQAYLRAGGSMVNQPDGVIPANSGTGQMIGRFINAFGGKIANAVKILPGGDTAVSVASGVGKMAGRAAASNNQLRGVRFNAPTVADLTMENLRRPGGLSALAGFYGGETASRE